MSKLIFSFIFTLSIGIYNLKAQITSDTIKHINKQNIACTIKKIEPEMITYEVIQSENKVNITLPIEQVESIKWSDGKITFINSTEGNISNNLSKQLSHLDSVFYKTGERYNNEYNSNQYSTNLIFYSTVLFSGAATFTPCLIAYFVKPNPTYYHGPNEIVKKNKSFQAGYKAAASEVKKTNIALSWLYGTVINAFAGIIIYKINKSQ